MPSWKHCGAMRAIAFRLDTLWVFYIVVVVLHIVPQFIGQPVDAYVVSAHTLATDLGDRNRQDCSKSTNPHFWLSYWDLPAASQRARRGRGWSCRCRQ